MNDLLLVIINHYFVIPVATKQLKVLFKLRDAATMFFNKHRNLETLIERPFDLPIVNAATLSTCHSISM